MRDIRLLDRMFIPGTLIGPFTQANPGLGGVCTFVGEVRYDAKEQGGVEALELTHYEPLTLPGMHELADRAFARFDLMGLLMVHRVGMMRPGEPRCHRRGRFLHGPSQKRRVVLEAGKAGRRMALDRAARSGPQRSCALVSAI
jgi:MoaE protein